MIRKFGQLTILATFFFLSLFVGVTYLFTVSYAETISRKNKFLEAVNIALSQKERNLFQQLEYHVREGELPYYSSLVGEAIQKNLGLSSIKIYDKSLRLIYSSTPTKELFQPELRHDETPLGVGRSRELSSGEIVYRLSSGDFFIQFPKINLPMPLLINPNIELGFTYWLFDEKTGNIHFTNDFDLLSGDRETKDLLASFSGKQNRDISWKVNGEDGYLEKISLKNTSIYLIDSANFFPKWAFPRSILISISVFSILCIIKLSLVIWNRKSIPLSRLDKQNIIYFFLTLFFYQGVTSFLPDFRYQIPWIKMRFEQTENLLIQLEKNITNQLSYSDLEQEISRKNFDPIVKEIYLWQKEKHNLQLTNRFSAEIESFLMKLESTDTSRIIEANYEYLYVIPIKDKSQSNVFVILVLDPLFMGSKKEKDRDEFYFPNTSFRLSEDVSRESYLIEPRVWDKEVLSSVRHQGSGHSHFSILDLPFKVYFFSVVPNDPTLTDGLFVYKSEGVFQILVYAASISFFPLLLLSVISKWRRIQSRPEENSFAEEINPPKMENIPAEEAIAETSSIGQNGGVSVKKQIHGYIPPSLWKKNVSSLPKELQRKRESIFNPELKTLVEQVSAPDTGLGRRQSDNKKIPSLWDIPEEKKAEYTLLDRVYRGDEVSLDGIVEYTRNFIQRLGSPRFSFLFLNDTIGSYHSQISFGLDYNTRSNLIFLYNDPFLQFDDKGFTEIHIDEKVKLDKFISKKFSWEILAQVETILAFNLENLGFPGLFLILLDKQEKTKFLEPHKRMIQEKLRQILPALHVLMEKEDKTPDLFEDSLSWMVRSFLQATLGGQRNAYVTNVVWENYHPTDANEAKKAAMLQQVTKIVESKDRVIENSPNAFLVITEKNIKEPLEKLLKSYPFPYETRYMKYPDDGENYYLYI